MLSALLVTAAGVTGCGRLTHLHGNPPFETYAKGEYRSPITKKVYTPPQAALGPWKVMALQTEPRPVENPHWTSITVSDSGELTMPRGSAFRCIYNPAKLRAEENEPPKEVEGWEVMREVRCSDNGFRTWSTAGVKFLYDAQGTVRAKSSDRAELDLAEVIGGRPTRVSILLRPEGNG